MPSLVKRRLSLCDGFQPYVPKDLFKVVKPGFSRVLETQVTQQFINSAVSVCWLWQIINTEIQRYVWWFHVNVGLDGRLWKSKGEIDRLHMPIVSACAIPSLAVLHDTVGE